VPSPVTRQMASKALTSSAVLAVIAAATVIALTVCGTGGGARPQAGAGPAPAAAERQAQAEALSVSLPLPMSPFDDGPAFVQPDGQRLPLLNGVRESVVLKWPSDEPYSPIVGRRVESRGGEWYVHADGSRSTVKMVWRSDLGRAVAATVLARPTEPAPMKTPGQELGESGRVPRER